MASGWRRRFDDPIPLPNGRQVLTLKDAAEYVQKLPKAEQLLDKWQAAVEALLLIVELNGPTMMARIGMLRALNRGYVREFDSSRKDTHWGNESSRGTNDDRLDLRRYQVPSWPPRLSQGFCQSGRRGRMVQGERFGRGGIRI